MENNKFISTAKFCEFHEVEYSFISSLNEYGLIELVALEEEQYLPIEQISNVEKMIHLHYDLDINIAGIEAISHLLERVDNLHKELQSLKNNLDFYK